MGQSERLDDATKQDVSLSVNLQSEPCAGNWAGLLRSDNSGILYALQPQAWTFVRCQEMCWGFCAHDGRPFRFPLVRIICIVIFVLGCPACLQFSDKPSSVGSRPTKRQRSPIHSCWFKRFPQLFPSKPIVEILRLWQPQLSDD